MVGELRPFGGANRRVMVRLFAKRYEAMTVN